MKIPIQNPPSLKSLRTDLHAQFPDYEMTVRGDKFLVVKKNSTCGVNVIIRKDKLIVNGNFPTMTGQLIFTLTFILLGIIIPLIIYFFTFHKKFKAMEKEVGTFLENKY